MEKRNFTTAARTVDATATVDEFVETAAGLFGTTSKSATEFEKKAQAEDERSDA